MYLVFKQLNRLAGSSFRGIKHFILAEFLIQSNGKMIQITILSLKQLFLGRITIFSYFSTMNNYRLLIEYQIIERSCYYPFPKPGKV
mgnify:CR=1 FL=1